MNNYIEGIKITPLKIISDHRGSVMHMLRNDSEVFEKFGEIYFSTVAKDGIKAWHLHKEATLNYVCVKGFVKLVLFDDRNSSSMSMNPGCRKAAPPSMKMYSTVHPGNARRRWSRLNPAVCNFSATDPDLF